MSASVSAADPTMRRTALPVTTYTPESPLREPRKLFRAMFSDLVASRELAWRLFVRDTSAQYRQSILGYVWAFVPPLATTVVFTFLDAQQILNIGDTDVPYPAFVMIGTVLWQSFLDALNSPLRAMNASRPMLSKINFPREALILGGMADVVFNLLVRVMLVVATLLYYRLSVGPSVLLAPVGMLALLLLGLSIGTLVTPLGMLYSDVARGVALISGFWMLLTPVIYPPPATGVGAVLATWNPVSPVLLTARQWPTGQPATSIEGFILVTAAAFVALFGGWILLRLALPHVIERIGN